MYRAGELLYWINPANGSMFKVIVLRHDDNGVHCVFSDDLESEPFATGSLSLFRTERAANVARILRNI